MQFLYFLGRTKVGPVYTYLYEADTFTLFKTNNMAVFRYGLIDLSKNMNGVPIVASMPHFLYGDPDLVKMFNTKPNVSAHNTYVSIKLQFTNLENFTPVGGQYLMSVRNNR